MQCNTLYYQLKFNNSFSLKKTIVNIPMNTSANDDAPREQDLHLQIERLREQFPHTQDLYREVCVLMFFRYGTTPTANKLYQLVRKGSMSAPAEALTAFWDNLREKSRVRIEHPDLPPALKTAAGELTATLWASAQQLAHETLTACRLEAQQQVDAASAAVAATQLASAALQGRLQDQENIGAQALRRIGALEQETAGLMATNLSLTAQLQQTREQATAQQQQAREQAMLDQQAHQQQLQDARREFTAELDQLRAANQLANERSLAVETRALLEIDRERTALARLQKELDAVRAAAIKAALHAVERHRIDVDALQVQLGDQRQQGGVLQGQLQGQLQSAIANRDAIALELTQAKAQSSAASAQASALQSELNHWQRQHEEAQRLLAEVQMASKTTRAYRKSRTG
jgi:hypothetical protein